MGGGHLDRAGNHGLACLLNGLLPNNYATFPHFQNLPASIHPPWQVFLPDLLNHLQQKEKTEGSRVMIGIDALLDPWLHCLDFVPKELSNLNVPTNRVPGHPPVVTLMFLRPMTTEEILIGEPIMNMSGIEIGKGTVTGLEGTKAATERGRETGIETEIGTDGYGTETETQEDPEIGRIAHTTEVERPLDEGTLNKIVTGLHTTRGARNDLRTGVQVCSITLTHSLRHIFTAPSLLNSTRYIHPSISISLQKTCKFSASILG